VTLEVMIIADVTAVSVNTGVSDEYTTLIKQFDEIIVKIGWRVILRHKVYFTVPKV